MWEDSDDWDDEHLDDEETDDFFMSEAIEDDELGHDVNAEDDPDGASDFSVLGGFIKTLTGR